MYYSLSLSSHSHTHSDTLIFQISCPCFQKLVILSTFFPQDLIMHGRCTSCSIFVLHSIVQSVEGFFCCCWCLCFEGYWSETWALVCICLSLSHSLSASPLLASLFIMKRSDSSSVLSPLCNYPFAASVCVQAPLKRAHFSSPFKLYFIVDASGLCLFIRRVIGERNK